MTTSEKIHCEESPSSKFGKVLQDFILLFGLVLVPLSTILVGKIFGVEGTPVESSPSSMSPSTVSSPVPGPPPFLPEGLISLSSDSNFSPYAFVVDKSRRLLHVFQSQEGGESGYRLVASYPTDIGKRKGEKTKANDFKTPVGIYFLRKHLHPPEISFDLYGSQAFVTDYPNIFDRRDAKTGNGIWLHAIPDQVALTRGSRGCVVVRDQVIQELGPLVKLGQTPLLIYDQVSSLSGEEHNRLRSTYLGHLESWRKSWETDDVDTYIQYYDSSFKNAQMNYHQWYKHKKHLRGLYKYVRVQLLGQPLVFKNKNQVVIRVLQRYESDLHQDYGEKTLHAYYSESNGFRIIREDWRPLPWASRTMAGHTTAAAGGDERDKEKMKDENLKN